MLVRDLIVELQKHPLDQEVVIDDADTGWIITQIHVGFGEYGKQYGDERLHLWGIYSEMKHD